MEFPTACASRLDQLHTRLQLAMPELLQIEGEFPQAVEVPILKVCMITEGHLQTKGNLNYCAIRRLQSAHSDLSNYAATKDFALRWTPRPRFVRVVSLASLHEKVAISVAERVRYYRRHKPRDMGVLSTLDTHNLSIQLQ